MMTSGEGRRKGLKGQAVAVAHLDTVDGAAGFYRSDDIYGPTKSC